MAGAVQYLKFGFCAPSPKGRKAQECRDLKLLQMLLHPRGGGFRTKAKGQQDPAASGLPESAVCPWSRLARSSPSFRFPPVQRGPAGTVPPPP